MNNNNPKDLQCNGKDVSQILRDVSVLSLSVVQIRFVFGHQDNMSMCFIPPYTPLLYSKTGVYRGLDYFLIFALKHILWVHVRTASILTCTHQYMF